MIMKKNIILIIACVCVVLGFSSCSKSEIPTWTDTARIWFASKDTTSFTFALYPDSTSKIINIPLTVAGNVESVDRTFDVSVVSNFRNSSSKYEIIQPTVIKKDTTSGFLRVRVYKTDNLNIARDTITFQLNNSDDFVVGLTGYLKGSLIVYNKFVQPTWWNRSATYSLGRYTELKLSIIFKVLGNITNTPLSSDKAKRAYNIYMLNKYCTDNGPLYDYDGKLVKFASGY
jgi:hypothetical protein